MDNGNFQIDIGGKLVGDGLPCFLVAEVGSNHNHNFDLAKRLIDEAGNAGVDAIKFQTFKAAEHYSKYTPGFSYLDNTDTHGLIKSLELNRDWQAPLKKHAEDQGLIYFSSPCDTDAVNQLSELDTAAYKIASFDLPDTGLIETIANTRKPM